MFSLYTRRVPSLSPSSHTQVFADDIMIDYSSKSVDEIRQNLSNAVGTLATWLSDRGLILNEKKTQVLAIPASTGQDIQLNVTCNGVHLGQTDTAKYLGVVMDERLSWSGHVSSIVRKVSGKLVSLWKIRQVLSESVMKHLYKSLLVPDILYCSNAYSRGCLLLLRTRCCG